MLLEEVWLRARLLEVLLTGNININYAKEDIAKMVIMTYASFVGLDFGGIKLPTMIFLPMQGIDHLSDAKKINVIRCAKIKHIVLLPCKTINV